MNLRKATRRHQQTSSNLEIMRHLFTATAAAAVFLALHAGEAAAQQTRINAILIPHEGNPSRIWINEATETQVRYYDTEVTTALSNIPRSQVRSVFFEEPTSLSTAIQQFRGRDYQTAMQGFSRVAAEYRPVRALPGNPSTRAAFFEIECLRLLGEYGRMSEKLGEINKSGLIRENELRQLELNLMWEAVGSEAWDRLERLVRQRADSDMPGNQRAQVAYCAGLVHHQKGETREAIDAYNEAMIVDAGASEVVARLAVTGILRIFDEDPEVQEAREAWGTENERPDSDGHVRLLEAGAVARIYETFIGAEFPLPDAYMPYLEYKAPDSES